MNLLEVINLKVNYGSINAVKGISFSIPKGQIVSLVGSNGAGKTSTLRAISGLVSTQGEIFYKNEMLTSIPIYDRIKKGIAQAPEGRGIFLQMTVFENLELGAYTRNDTKNIFSDMEKCFHFFPRLKERQKQIAGTLSGGEQQMLAISRALMSRPELLILDEPSLGLAPIIVSQIFEIIKTLNKQEKMTILLVEQNARLALKISDYAYVLETGLIKLSGTGTNLLINEDVQKSYLGI